MHLRYPEGIRSIVDADLALRGNYASPTLGGTVTVKSALWNRRIDTPGSIFDLASRRSSAAAAVAGGGEAAPTTVPLRFDLQILVPVDAAGRQQPRAHGGQRRTDAARHLRSTA